MRKWFNWTVSSFFYCQDFAPIIELEDLKFSHLHNFLQRLLKCFRFKFFFKEFTVSRFSINDQCSRNRPAPLLIDLWTKIIGVCFIKPYDGCIELMLFCKCCDLFRESWRKIQAYQQQFYMLIFIAVRYADKGRYFRHTWLAKCSPAIDNKHITISGSYVIFYVSYFPARDRLAKPVKGKQYEQDCKGKSFHEIKLRKRMRMQAYGKLRSLWGWGLRSLDSLKGL